MSSRRIVNQMARVLSKGKDAEAEVVQLLNEFECNNLSRGVLSDEEMEFYEHLFHTEWFMNSDAFMNLLIDIRACEFTFNSHQKHHICDLLEKNARLISNSEVGLVLLDFFELFLDPEDAFEIILNLSKDQEFVSSHIDSFFYVLRILAAHNKDKMKLHKNIRALAESISGDKTY